MTTINLRQQSAKKLDAEKRQLEAGGIVRLNRIFANMANDAENLYKATGSIPAQELSVNYNPEFIKEIRDLMRKTIKRFGFSLRKTIEKKYGLFFDAELKQSYMDLTLKQAVIIQDNDIDEKLEDINNQFLIDSTLFIANESEQQTQFIEQTNTKMINTAITAGLVAFANEIASRQNEINRLASKLPDASISQRAKITRQINAVNRQIELANANSQAIVAKNIKSNLLDKSPARSELIASQNVGLAESWSRQKEAELIDGANLVSASAAVILFVKKEWVAILDSKTRSSHAAADGQQVGVNQSFVVEGESLRYPRDPNGSAANIINCRCISDFEVQ